METIKTPPTLDEVKQDLAVLIKEIGLVVYPNHLYPFIFSADIILFPPGDHGNIKANFQIKVTEQGIFYAYGKGEQTFIDFEVKLKELYPEATRTNG